MVPEEGVEPTRPCGHRILSPARLPVPPLRACYFKITCRRPALNTFAPVFVWSAAALLPLFPGAGDSY